MSSTSPWLASSRVLSALAGLAFVVGLVGHADEPVLQPDYRQSLASVHFSSVEGEPMCDGECQQAIAKVSSVQGVDAVVPASLAEFTVGAMPRRLVLVDPADLDGVDDALASQLRSEPSTVLIGAMEGPGNYSVDDFAPLGLTAEGLGDAAGCCAVSTANRRWAQDTLGDLPTAAFLIYVSEGADRHLADRQVRDIVLAGNGAVAVDSNVQFDSPGSSVASSIVGVAYGLVLAALVLTPMAAISTATVVRRRRDDATLAALGAPAQTLRASLVIEATITSAIALGSGLLGGALTHAAIVGGSRAVLAVSASSEFSVTNALASVPWLAYVMLLAISVTVFALTSFVASRSLLRQSPVEGLRPVKSGGFS